MVKTTSAECHVTCNLPQHWFREYAMIRVQHSNVDAMGAAISSAVAALSSTRALACVVSTNVDADFYYVLIEHWRHDGALVSSVE